MSNTREPALRFELLEADNFTQYLLSEGREIAFVLRQLAAKRSMITAYFGSSNKFLITSIVNVADDERSVLMDLPRDDALNLEALQSGQLMCITQLEKVKVQFELSGLQRENVDGLPALRAPLPNTLLRLQRREYYRLTAPVSHSLVCNIRPRDGSAAVEARVLDISGGGLAVVVPPSGVSFAPEMEFVDCRIELPDFGPITTTLRVRNIFRITSRSGVDMLRAGCQFEKLSTPMSNAIQRYILRVERERKAREANL